MKKTHLEYGVGIKEAALHGETSLTYADQFDTPEDVFTSLGWARVALLNSGISYPFVLSVDTDKQTIHIKKGDSQHPEPTEPYEGTAISRARKRPPSQIPGFVTNLTKRMSR